MELIDSILCVVVAEEGLQAEIYQYQTNPMSIPIISLTDISTIYSKHTCVARYICIANLGSYYMLLHLLQSIG